MEPQIELGRTYRDTLHGTEGIATAHTKYLTGCNRVCLDYAKDGEIKCNWFDTAMVELVPCKVAAVTPPLPGHKPGGPGIVAPSRDPSR